MRRAATFQDITNRHNVMLWLLLAFQAGFINAGGFMAFARFVSHVTGYGSHVGLQLSERNYSLALEMSLAPVFFIAGATFSGYLIDREIYQNKAPKIEVSLVIQSSLLFLMFVLGEIGLLGVFGEPLVLQRGFALLFSLCFVCGLQNATFTCLTNGQIRTTHMTGIATDFGMNLVRIPYLIIDDKERERQKRINAIRFWTFSSFMIGSAVAAEVFYHVGYHGFIIPSVTSLLVLIQSRRIMSRAV